uniref:Uncharacterized protein n=1 Tax=Dulem virus 42 TaxID=3145760 RepID=A0AAU8B7X4_9CAUD
MFTQKFAKQMVDGDKADMADVRSELDDLDLIEEYVGLVKRANQLEKAERTPYEQEEYQNLIAKIKLYDDYFKGEGKYKDAISELMYNPKNLSADNMAYINGVYAFGNDNYINWKPGWDIKEGVAGFGRAIGRGIDLIGHALDWTATTIAQGLSSIGIGPNMEGYKTKKVVQNIEDWFGRESFEGLADDIYIGSEKNKRYIASQIDLNKLNERRKYNQDRLKELDQTLKEDIDFAQNGRLKLYVPFTNTKMFDGKFYDPEDIPEQFKRDQEKYAAMPFAALYHPWYVLPEVASSVELFKYNLGAMVGDFALNKVLTSVVNRNPYLFTVTQGAQMIGSSAMTVGASTASREAETNLEKIQGQQERIINEFKNRNVNVNDVFNKISQYANNVLSIDTRSMTDDELLTLALAYDMPISTPGYKESVNASKKGIMQLINANNALMMHDVLEALPFMTYGGRAFKRALNDAGSKIAFNNPTLRNAVERQFAESAKYASNGIIDKVTKKFLAKDHPKLALWTNHAGEYLKDKLKLAAYEGFMESGEEGVQELLKNRYVRGEYDDYNRAYSMFDVAEIANIPGLYTEAMLDYLGLNSNDPDNASENIRQAMNIGFSASFMFSGALKSLSNISSDPYISNERNLIAQLKADNVVSDIIGTYAQEAQDHNHIATFFDSYAKNGKSGAHIVKALNTLRRNVDENNTLVKKSDIDADIQLAKSSWFIYNNDAINDQLKENGIKKNSAEHKQLVIDGTTALVTLD